MVVGQVSLQLERIVESPTPLLDLVTQLLKVREEDVVRLNLVDSLLNLQAHCHMQHKDIHLLLGVKLRVVVRVARVVNHSIIRLGTTINLIRCYIEMPFLVMVANSGTDSYITNIQNTAIRYLCHIRTIDIK